MAQAPPNTQEVLRELVQRVGRAYYEPKLIVILDLLAFNSMMKEEELAKGLEINGQDTRRLCAKLVQDGLIKVHSETEEVKESGRHARKFTRSHYYIDYKKFLNAVKYRMLKTQQMIQNELDSQNQNRNYFCTLCQVSYDPIEVLRMMRPSDGMFECEVCQSELVLEEGADVENDLTKRFNTERKKIRDLLQTLDTMTIPDPVLIASTATVKTVTKGSDTHINQNYVGEVKVEMADLGKSKAFAVDMEGADSDVTDYYARLAQQLAETSAPSTPEAEAINIHGKRQNGEMLETSNKRARFQEPSDDDDDDVDEEFEEV